MKKMNLFAVLFLIISVGIYTGCEKKQVVKSDETPAVQESAAKEETALKSIYFDFDKAAIKPGDRAVLKEIADYLLKDKNIKISIEGNCDERGTEKYNLVLGDKRAKAAMTYLVNLGVDKKRIKTISNGKDKPLDSGHNEEAWAKNRRDDFVVNMK
ncbi:MAG: peptidoglycan-associated lipoprotein Pal [Smithellaceae bacterium]